MSGAHSSGDSAPTDTGREGDAAPSTADDQRSSLLNAVGGGRGALETSLPGLVFVVIFAVWHLLEDLGHRPGRVVADVLPDLGLLGQPGERDVRVSAVVAAGVGVALLVARLVRRDTVQYAIGGFAGVLIAVLFAVSTGDATNYFLPSILKNLGFGLLYLVSVLVRWPVLGVLLGPLLKENFAWRHHDARRRAYAQATLIWAAMFAVRLAVMLPLYLLGQTVALGIASAALGWPVFAVVAWATWMVIRRVPPVRPDGA